MKKILFLLLLIFGNLSFSEYVKEGTYNGANDKKIYIGRYSYSAYDEFLDEEVQKEGYTLLGVIGYGHSQIFHVDKKNIQVGEKVEFSITEHELNESTQDYRCKLIVKFEKNGEMSVDTDDCYRDDDIFIGNYTYSEKDSAIPEKYFGKWDNCIYVYEKGFTTNIDFGENYVVGVKEEGDGNLLLDGITVNEGTAFRDQYRFKYHPNGNVSIKEYRGSESNKLEKSYNNLKRLKGREASDCQTFEDRN